jgi:hypothetical protein
MQAALIAYTQRNPALTPESVKGLGDLATIWDGKGTYAENVIEYAGRVCYRSTHRMGTAQHFIADRVREGHEDIIEHVVVTVRVAGLAPDAPSPPAWRMINRHCEVSDLGAGTWLVSGNTRVWVDFFRQGIALEALPLVRAVAPAVFAEFAGEPLTLSPPHPLTPSPSHPLTLSTANARRPHARDAFGLHAATVRRS